MIGETGDEYVGEWKHGKADGYGVMTWVLGTRYEGLWKENRRNGFGTFYYLDGVIYRGDWVENKRHGKGTLIFPDGSLFIGEFKDDNVAGGEGRYYAVAFALDRTFPESKAEDIPALAMKEVNAKLREIQARSSHDQIPPASPYQSPHSSPWAPNPMQNSPAEAAGHPSPHVYLPPPPPPSQHIANPNVLGFNNNYNNNNINNIRNSSSINNSNNAGRAAPGNVFGSSPPNQVLGLGMSPTGAPQGVFQIPTPSSSAIFHTNSPLVHATNAGSGAASNSSDAQYCSPYPTQQALQQHHGPVQPQPPYARPQQSQSPPPSISRPPHPQQSQPTPPPPRQATPPHPRRKAPGFARLKEIGLERHLLRDLLVATLGESREVDRYLGLLRPAGLDNLLSLKLRITSTEELKEAGVHRVIHARKLWKALQEVDASTLLPPPTSRPQLHHFLFTLFEFWSLDDPLLTTYVRLFNDRLGLNLHEELILLTEKDLRRLPLLDGHRIALLHAREEMLELKKQQLFEKQRKRQEQLQQRQHEQRQQQLQQPRIRSVPAPPALPRSRPGGSKAPTPPRPQTRPAGRSSSPSSPPPRPSRPVHPSQPQRQQTPPPPNHPQRMEEPPRQRQHHRHAQLPDHHHSSPSQQRYKPPMPQKRPIHPNLPPESPKSPNPVVTSAYAGRGRRGSPHLYFGDSDERR